MKFNPSYHTVSSDPTAVKPPFDDVRAKISNVGYEHVDRKTVSDAVAGETLFIHGSSVDTGNLAVLKAAATTAGGTKMWNKRNDTPFNYSLKTTVPKTKGSVFSP